MILYHMNDTLQLGNEMVTDYKHKTALAQPFLQALEHGEECFWSIYLSAKYLRAVLGKFHLRSMDSDYVKWAVESAFEYVRQKEFPQSCSRLKANYFYDDLNNVKTLYEVDLGRAPAEERAAIRLYEVELDDQHPQRNDMRLFDEAYDAMWEHESLKMVLNCARRYFSAEQSAEPLWELLSEHKAVASVDRTRILRC